MSRAAASALALALGAALAVTAAGGGASATSATSSAPSTARPSAPAASAALVTVFATLRGSNEAAKRDMDGSGRAQISLNVAKQKACWSLHVAGVGGPLSAHVAQAPKGKDGPVVIPLGAKYAARGCVTAPKKSIRAVANNPAAYYVNVHTQKFLNGAVRGQLHK